MATAFPAPKDVCLACNRYIGLTLECPYCGLESPQRPLQCALRMAAFTLSAAGLIALLFIGSP